MMFLDLVRVVAAAHVAGSAVAMSEPGAFARDGWRERERLTGDWLGVRSSIEEAGITLDASLFIDWTANFKGGIRTGSGVQHLFIASLAFDMDTLFNHAGGTVYGEFQWLDGKQISRNFVGDVQTYSNIEEERRAQLAEVWYEQRLLDDRLRVKVGKVDANTEFAVAENALEFLNSSMGFTPTVFLLPTYPDPAMSVNIFFQPLDSLILGLGVYDGSLQRGVRTGARGPRSVLSSRGAYFLIGEVGLQWGDERNASAWPGRLALGAWHHTGRIDRWTGGTQPGTTGLYAVLDQTIWRAGPAEEDATAGLFMQYGYAEARVSEIEHHAGGGLVWTGIVPGRPDDVIGLGASWARLSEQAGFVRGSETAIELFYQARLTPWLVVQPDLQFIRHPGGERGHALVGTLRFWLNF